ncbi:ISAs1 family transposase [Parablautia muri]|nr:ISAs1 family transposase [Parablautia muri]
MGNLDLRGCVVTADALNTQKETARAIVKKAHGDYCLALKENQKTVYNEVKEYFADEKLLKETMAADGKYLKETEKKSGSIVTREYFITDDIKWFEDRKEWEKLSSIGYERKIITRTGADGTVREERYFLCSIKPNAELFSIAARRHWNIENNLHWALDIVFSEDKLRSKEKNGIHNLGLSEGVNNYVSLDFFLSRFLPTIISRKPSIYKGLWALPTPGLWNKVEG